MSWSRHSNTFYVSHLDLIFWLESFSTIHYIIRTFCVEHQTFVLDFYFIFSIWNKNETHRRYWVTATAIHMRYMSHSSKNNNNIIIKFVCLYAFFVRVSEWTKWDKEWHCHELKWEQTRQKPCYFWLPSLFVGIFQW